MVSNINSHPYNEEDRVKTCTDMVDAYSAEVDPKCGAENCTKAGCAEVGRDARAKARPPQLESANRLSKFDC